MDTKGRNYRYRHKKEYHVRTEAEGQGLMFGPSSIEKALLRRKEKKRLTDQERQAIRELTRGGPDRYQGRE